MALPRTAATQARFAEAQIHSLKQALGDRMHGTVAQPADPLSETEARQLVIDGVSISMHYTDAHFPGDAMIYLPASGIVFSGDLVYVDRLLGVLPDSSVVHARASFAALAALKPAQIIPGHGRVCDLGKARRESGDYYDFLVNTIGEAAKAMEPMDETIKRYARHPAFMHLENYDALHRINMNRVFTQFESQ